MSMPWPYYNMPSIQVAVLKAYLESQEIPCDVINVFQQVCDYLGPDIYNHICSPTLEDGEILYSCLLYEEQLQKTQYNARYINKLKEKIDFEFFGSFVEEFRSFNESILSKINIEDYSLIGFTLNFGQTLASIYFASEIKKINKNVKIIFGGAEATGALGQSLLEAFPCIDFVCNGEGELPLLELSKVLLEKGQEADVSMIKGIGHRIANQNVCIVNPPNQLQSLDSLPVPDFSDFFDYITNEGKYSHHDLSVVLPIESSRGCYYKCSFCSLNIQWTNTRFQSAPVVKRMMQELSSKYYITDFFFVDNITPINSNEIFTEVASDNIDYRFFYEMRANIKFDDLVVMRRAGLTRVQIGIESLSTSLLKKFNKKSKFIHNLQGMKNCEELGIIISGNLLTEHPETSLSDIEETLANMPYCFGYQPIISTSEFGLMYGSPDYNSPRSTFEVAGNHRMYLDLYPESIFNRLNLPTKDYKLKVPYVSWERVIAALGEWKQQYSVNKRNTFVYYDGSTFLKIEDKRFGQNDVYILDQTERSIYLTCHQIKDRQMVYNSMPSMPSFEIDKVLKELCALKLMYEEDGYYLSLAIPSKSRSMILKVD